MLWDFEYKLRVTERARRPDLTLEDRAKKDLDSRYGLPTGT